MRAAGRFFLRACILMLATLPLGAAAQEQARATGAKVFDLPLGSGATQRALWLPASAPRATLVMFPGGAGRIGLGPDGSIRHGRNVLVRTRALWLAAGFNLLIPDAIDGRSLRGARSRPAYAAVAAKLVDLARARSPAPVFLVGTSQGAIAAANAAATAKPGSVAGLVLTEAVSRPGGSGETVFDTDLAAVAVPALVVANADDRCPVAPPQDAARIAAAMTRSPDASVAHVSGGRDGAPCASLSPHGYFGIEARVVDRIAGWIGAHLR